MQKEFAVSPVYFDLEDAPESIKQQIDWQINTFLNVNDNNTVEGPRFLLLKYLFASICYHYDDLNFNLSTRHRLRASQLFIGATRNIRKYTVIQFPWNKSSSTPGFTGLPPHVVLMVETEVLKQRIEEQRKDILDGLKAELDRRYVGGEKFEAHGILQEVSKLHEKIADTIKAPTNVICNTEKEEDGIFKDFFHIEDDDCDEELGFDINESNEINVNEENDYQQLPKVVPRGIVLSWKKLHSRKNEIVVQVIYIFFYVTSKFD